MFVSALLMNMIQQLVSLHYYCILVLKSNTTHSLTSVSWERQGLWSWNLLWSFLNAKGSNKVGKCLTCKFSFNSQSWNQCKTNHSLVVLSEHILYGASSNAEMCNVGLEVWIIPQLNCSNYKFFYYEQFLIKNCTLKVDLYWLLDKNLSIL